MIHHPIRPRYQTHHQIVQSLAFLQKVHAVSDLLNPVPWTSSAAFMIEAFFSGGHPAGGLHCSRCCCLDSAGCACVFNIFLFLPFFCLLVSLWPSTRDRLLVTVVHHFHCSALNNILIRDSRTTISLEQLQIPTWEFHYATTAVRIPQFLSSDGRHFNHQHRRHVESIVLSQ